MVDLITKARLIDASAFHVPAFEYDPAKVTLLNFAKETGGSGSTSSMMSVTELLISRKIPVRIVDLAAKQLDMAVPYAAVKGATVHQQDDGESNEAVVLRAVMAAKPGEVVLVQFPASAIEQIEALNTFLKHVLTASEAPVTATTIWTMDSDRCSQDTLEIMLDSTLPGPMCVNWPEWNGPPLLDDALERKIIAQGGSVFAIPALPQPYYNRFKRERIAPATQHAEGDAATQWEIDFWRHKVWRALGGLA